MNKFVCLLFGIGFSFLSYSQSNRLVDSFISSAENLYSDGYTSKSIKTYETVLPLISDSSSQFGQIALKLFSYYLQSGNEITALHYYDKLISSHVDDRDIRTDVVNEPYQNYRYRATKELANYLFINKQYARSAEYLDIAEYYTPYYTTSLSRYKAEKIGLALLKKQVYDVKNKQDSAMYYLLKRALEYDYKDQFPNYTTDNFCPEEKEINEQILAYFPFDNTLASFKTELSTAIQNLEFRKNEKTTKIKLELRGMRYILVVNSLKETKEDCINYIRQSPFWVLLEKKLPSKKEQEVPAEEKKAE